MSMSPNNPFEDPQNDQGYLQDQGNLPAKKSGKGCLIGCGVVGLLGLVLCCGGGIFMVQFGVGALGDQLQTQIAGDPAIVEHIGGIESMEVSWGATIEEAQQGGEQDSGLVFEIKGDKGSGKLLIKEDKSGGSDVGMATLILPDGTRIPIGLDSDGGGIEDLDADLEDMFDSGDIDSGDGAEDSGDADADSFEITVPDVPEASDSDSTQT